MAAGYKKVRGGNRRLKAIADWVDRNKVLNMDVLDTHGRDYVKFRVKPWSNLLFGNAYEPPKGKLKLAVLEGLSTIFEHWNTQLKALGKPYYLKIWLFENHFVRSQVVCAVGDKANFYDHTFYKRSNVTKFEQASKYVSINQFGPFQWEQCAEVDILPIDFRTSDLYEPINERRILGTEIIRNKSYYVIELNQVWVGGQDE